MNALFRTAGRGNAQGGGLLSLTVILLCVSVLAGGSLVIGTLPTYAEPSSSDSVARTEGDSASKADILKAENESPERRNPMSGDDSNEPLLENEDVENAQSQSNDALREAPPAEATQPHASLAEVERPSLRSPFRRAAALTASSCLNGSVFSMRNDGTLVEVLANGRTRNFPAIPAEDFRRPPYAPTPEGDLRTTVNALGVGADAQDIYAIRHYEYRYNPASQIGLFDYVIYKYDHDRSRWVRQMSRTSNGLNVPYIAGAVQLNTGMFYFGTYDAPGDVNDWRALRFRLYRFDPKDGSTRDLGSFDTGRELEPGEPYNSAANGDMAFDDDGNLFVVRSGRKSYRSSRKETSIHSVSAEALARANGGRIQATSTEPIETPGDVNGIAFDAHGRIFLQDTTTIRQRDPIDYEDLGVFKSGLSEATDLATCASPATIRLRKNVEARRLPSDQFVLNLMKNGSGGRQTPIPSVTTTGSKTGIQAETIGVFPVRTGTRYSFSENVAPGSASAASDYQSRWVCEDGNGQIGSGSGRSGSVLIPNRASVEVICTFTNAPQSGSLVWEKVDSDDLSAHLEGSVWTLDGQLPPGRSQTVRDCVTTQASQCQQRDNDTDPRSGYFRVEGLYLGRYSLQEQTPPSGYEGTARTFTKTLSTGGQEQSFGKIENKRLLAQIRVVKEVRDPAGTKVADASGWTVAVDLEKRVNGTLSPLQSSGDPWFGKHQVTDASGAVAEQWTVSFPNASTTQDIRVTEVGRPDSYSASLRCTSNKRQPIEGSGTGVNITAVQAGEQLTCVITNKQLPGSIVWEKTDPSGTYLAASEWRVRTAVQGAFTVKDCVRAGACRGLHDVDPRPGRFQLEGLKWQTVTLEELNAPPGYRRDTAARELTIREGALQANFGRIANSPVTLPPLPFTGGMSADGFLIAGAAAIGVALAAAFARVSRRSDIRGLTSFTLRPQKRGEEHIL